jgi:hypothetical protein
MRDNFWTVIAWIFALAAWTSLFIGYFYAEFLVPDVPHTDGTMSDHRFAEIMALIQSFGFGTLAVSCSACCKPMTKPIMLVPVIIGRSIALGVIAIIVAISVIR